MASTTPVNIQSFHDFANHNVATAKAKVTATSVEVETSRTNSDSAKRAFIKALVVRYGHQVASSSVQGNITSMDRAITAGVVGDTLQNATKFENMHQLLSESGLADFNDGDLVHVTANFNVELDTGLDTRASFDNVKAMLSHEFGDTALNNVLARHEELSPDNAMSKQQLSELIRETTDEYRQLITDMGGATEDTDLYQMSFPARFSEHNAVSNLRMDNTTIHENFDNVLLIAQKYSLIVSDVPEAGIRDRYIGTSGMGPCVGLHMYDAKTHTSYVAHFDDSSVRSSHTRYEALKNIESDIEDFMRAVQEHPKSGGSPQIKANVILGSGAGSSSHLIAAKMEMACQSHGMTSRVVHTQTGDFYASFSSGAAKSFRYEGRGFGEAQTKRLDEMNHEHTEFGTVNFRRLHKVPDDMVMRIDSDRLQLSPASSNDMTPNFGPVTDSSELSDLDIDDEKSYPPNQGAHQEG